LQEKLGHRIGLNAVASATLGVGKIASGLDAIRFYREGQWDKLKEYCISDVDITKQVFEYGIKNSKLMYKSRFGQAIKEVKVKWSAYNKRQVVKKLEETPGAEAQYTLF